MAWKRRNSFFHSLVIFTFLLQSTASFSVNAYVTVTYFNETSNYTKTETCECGVYGLASPVANAMGVVGIPEDGKYQACDSDTKFTNTDKRWIALIERGAGDIVAIMIGNLKGTKILQSIQRGIQVTMVIEVGKKHGPWVNHYSIFFVSVSFFIITAATVGYFIFYSARRLRNARAQSRKQRQLKADAKKAIGRLQLRTLKQGDKEIGPDGDSCAVCIELYKPNDLVRILTCNHIFHKTCVDPWLLEHRTCPMCKCDILKALGIEVDVEDGSMSLQVPVSNDASNTASPHEEDNRSETASSGYASVQGADEPPLEEHVQSANENLQLVTHEASSVAVDVVPHVDNPTFEEDESPNEETAVREIKSMSIET
ncbi:E3 ubiquitin-protein ligase RNF128 isoform X3 [Mesocricetus auratus]|uniref:E3 ubiquitin-protein ligase RNF128 isoform X3 n=1 Tax=Mesocricetus auratus TaxID=10036 RepID=A0ABM2XFS5_MESAU|nr:E3 ubiquitin-protein ligase RNF128 isoform X3 [Mesocricetus auratus]